MLKRKIIFLNILVFSAVSGISAQTDSTAVKPVLEKKNVMEYKLQSWPKIEKLESTRFSDHMFMSLGVGMEGFTNRQIVNSASTTGVNGAVSVGKWFNAISGARLGISVSSRGSGYENTGNQMIMGLTADYMLDFTSLIPMKYHYDRIFNFSLYTGFGGYFTTFDKTTSIDGQSPVTESVSKVVPGFRLGVNAGFKLNQATTLFFEPGITAYGKGIDPNNGDPLANSWRGFAIAPSFRAGISYRVIPVAYRKGVTDFLSAGFFDNTFITYAAGVEALVAGGDYDAALSDNMGGKAQFGIGKWFTASSGARLLANAGYVDWMVNGNNVGLDAKQSKKLAHIGFQADYLLNLSALFGGYQPDSRGGLLLIGGLNVNKSEKTALTGWSYGAGVGMQIYTRLMGNTDIFLEPRANFNTTKYAAGYSSSSYDITPSVMVGLTHYPRVDITRRKDTYDNAFYQGWEYSLGWGFGTPVTIATKSNLGKTMEPHLNANIAKWYNAYSGLRLDGRLGFMGSTENDHRTKFGTLGLFYQLNVTNAMMGYKNYSKTELVASVGPEIMYNSHSKNNPANLSMGASAGLKGIYNVCREFGIYIEPRIGIYQNKAFSSKSPFGKFDNAAFITAGVMYKPFIDEYSVEKMTRNSYNNWFIAAGAGINAPLNSLTIKEPFGDIINPIGNFYLGKWFTGVSGARLQLYGGSLAEVGPRVGNDIKTSTMIGAGLHYMVNFTNLTRGYKGVNRTEVIVTAGPEVLYNSKTSNSPSSIAYGFAGSVQGIWNVTDQLGLYLEPKLGVYSNKLVNGKLAKFEVDGLGSLSAGVIYNPFVRERRDGEMKPRVTDNWFFTVGAGANSLVTSIYRDMNTRDMISSSFKAGLGKWFNPISGFKLEANSMRLAEGYNNQEEKKDVARSKMIGAGLYYQANITNLLLGYDEYNSAELVLSVGPELFYTGGLRNFDEYRGFIGGASIGLQGIFNFNKSLGIYVEPRLGLYQGKLNSGHVVNTNFDLMAQVNAGLIWNMRDYDSSIERAKFKESDRNNLFVEAAAGVGTIFTPHVSSISPGPVMQFSLGKQYTPISAWRLTGRALVHENIYRKDQHIKYGEVELDYMMNIANLAGGYNDKWYDCSLFAGVAGGVSMQNGEYNVVGGFRAGAQFGINVGAGVTLFVEPSGVVYTKNFDGITYGRKFDAQMQAVAGLKYRFKNGNDTPERGEVAYKKYVQMGIGTGAYGRAMMRTPNSDRFTLNAELMTGRWFTPVSGFRIGLTNNNVAYRPKDEESHFNLKIFGLQLDYMINLTNLFGEVSHTRPVDLNGFFGVGINYGEHKRYIARTDSFDKDGDFAPSGAAGLQAIFNVSKSFGIYVEPAMYIYGDKIDAHENNRVKIDPAAKLTVGTIFKF